jgi:AcrR family transcriptional regulator
MRTVGSVGEETARLVRRAAVDLIAEHGFEAMSVRQLASRVGLTAGSLYNHFGSKQDLLSGLLQAVMEDLLSAVDRQVLQHRDPRLQLQAFIQVHIQFHVERKNDVLIATTELRSLSPENLKKIVRLRNRYEATLSHILRRGCARRMFKVRDTKVTALAMIPMLTGVTQWYRPSGRLNSEQLVEQYIELCFAMVGAPRAAALPLPATPNLTDEEHMRVANLGAKPRRASSSSSN